MHTVRLNIFSLIKDLEKRAGHDLYWTDISKKSQITRQTWDRLRTDQPGKQSDRIELRTIEKLLDFFEAEGMPITVADLFTITTSDTVTTTDTKPHASTSTALTNVTHNE